MEKSMSYLPLSLPTFPQGRVERMQKKKKMFSEDIQHFRTLHKIICSYSVMSLEAKDVQIKFGFKKMPI